MEQRKKKFKHLSWNDRLILERMLKQGYHKQIIADAIGCSLKTIYNEINRATYVHTNSDYTTELRYNPDEAQNRYEVNKRAKGRTPILKANSKLREYIETMIVDLDYSPEAVLMYIEGNATVKKMFDVIIKSVGTIYSAIKKGYFACLEMVNLPRKGKQTKRKKKVKKQKAASAGTSIEKRPEEVKDRKTFGHWEMDCVIGKATNKKTLLVLTERKSRMEIIEHLKAHTTYEVVKALNRIEKRLGSEFYKIFLTITVDNGSEFKDYEGMEKALYRVGSRTKVYYCHPHAPHERGSNENNNILIRRFLHKGMDFDKELKKKKLKEIEFWMNTYPRSIFGGKPAIDIFNKELELIGCKTWE